MGHKQRFIKGIAAAILAITTVVTPITPVNPLLHNTVTASAYAATGDYIEGSAKSLLKLKWNGQAVVEVNRNRPQFKKSLLRYKKVYIKAAGLDRYDRPHSVRAVLGNETVNNGYRESIGQFRPAGWHTTKYADYIDGLYVYNRCHLIGQAISAGKFSNTVNSKLNLITGTRYMNVDGMEGYENDILSYLRSGKGHVLYQVTPIYKDDELVCRGVWMRGYSMEDKGKSISFNVFCFNVQPGISINYADGSTAVSKDAMNEMKLALRYGATSVKSEASTPTSSGSAGNSAKVPKDSGTSKSTKGSDSKADTKREYVLNTNTKKFHLPDCKSVETIKPGNYASGKYNREELISEGYKPCKNCNP